MGGDLYGPTGTVMASISQSCHSYSSFEYFEKFKTLEEFWAEVVADHVKRGKKFCRVRVGGFDCGCQLRNVEGPGGAAWGSCLIKLDKEKGHLVMHAANWDSSD